MSSTQNKRDYIHNFYGVINADWLHHTVIPPTETRILPSYFIREEITKELQAIVDTEEKEHPSSAISRMLASWDKSVAAPIPVGFSAVLQYLLSANTSSDVCHRLGWMIRGGILTPLNTYVYGDPRDHTRCRLFVEETDPVIGIPEYWLDPSYVGHRRNFHAYVQALSRILGVEAIQMGYEAEREIVHQYPMEDIRKYDMLSWKELREQYPAFDWPTLLEAIGFTKEDYSRRLFNVTSRKYLRNLNHALHTWSIERWRGYLAFLAAHWIAKYSPHGPLRSAWFAYYRRFLQGTESDVTPHELRFMMARTLMTDTLGRKWVYHCCEPGMKRALYEMICNVRTAAASALGNTQWMSAKTRDAAIQKLRKMKIDICWPEEWDVAIESVVKSSGYVQNILRIGHGYTEKNIRRLQRKEGCKRRNRRSWSNPVYEVNAFYFPQENRFVLPAGILRPPYYDPAKSLAWNYGGIGSTIGHELCHAFDAEGRMFDEEGDLRDWWSIQDDKEYNKRSRRVVELFAKTPYRGLPVDGDLTLVENIADLGGTEFALAGLRVAVGRPLTQKEVQEFFISYATGWRSKDRLRRAKELLVMDPHAPPMLRVNNTVIQMDAWYDAFDITEDVPGFIPPEKRIHFFQ